MALTVRPLGSDIGAEIIGLDLTTPISEDDYRAVRCALLEQKVVVISDQSLDVAALVAFGRRFGRLVPHILDQYHHPETWEISIISNVVESGKGRTTAKPAGAYWHSDLSYDAEPADATMLYSLELPAAGGDTVFADMCGAYAGLPDATKRRIENLRAIHRHGKALAGGAVVELNSTQQAAHPEVEHPVVRVHPETGRKALFVNPGFTVRIVGVAAEESASLLAELYDRALRPELHYRHRWRVGQIVACDNRSTMHTATDDYPRAARRTLYRMIVGADRAI